MPLFEYRCKTCNHRFEQLRRDPSPDGLACPNCGGSVDRVFSAFGIRTGGRAASSEAASASSSSGGSGCSTCGSHSCTTCHH